MYIILLPFSPKPKKLWWTWPKEARIRQNTIRGFSGSNLLSFPSPLALDSLSLSLWSFFIETKRQNAALRFWALMQVRGHEGRFIVFEGAWQGMAPDGFPKDIVESTSKVFQVGKSAIKLTAGLAYQTALSSTLTAKTLRIPMNFATLGGYNVGASHVETSLFSNQALDVFGLGSCSDALRLRLVAGIPCVHSLQLSRPCSANNHRYGGAWHHCVNRCQPHA